MENENENEVENHCSKFILLPESKDVSVALRLNLILFLKLNFLHFKKQEKKKILLEGNF